MSRIFQVFGVVLAVMFTLAACEKASDAAKTAGSAVNDAAKATGRALDSAAQATGRAVESAATSTGNALEDTGDYLSRQRLARTAEEALAKLETSWRDLQDKTVTAGESAQNEFQEITEGMDRHLDDAGRKLTAVKEASGDAWEGAKSALDAALRKTQEFYDDAVARVSRW